MCPIPQKALYTNPSRTRKTNTIKICVKPWTHARTHTRIPMKTGSLSLASILANGCRSSSSRMALLRTLSTTHAALTKHSNKHVVACSYGSSQSKLFACESSIPDVTHNAPVKGYVLFHIFIAYILLGACNIGFLWVAINSACTLVGCW